MDTLQNAVFGEHPRLVCHIDIQSGDGLITRHYLALACAGSCTYRPKLCALYPAPGAPPHTLPLGGVRSSRQALNRLLANLPDYTATPPDEDEGACQVLASYQTLKNLVSRHKKEGATQFPESYCDEEVLDLFQDRYRLPKMFEVRMCVCVCMCVYVCVCVCHKQYMPTRSTCIHAMIMRALAYLLRARNTKISIPR